MDLESLGWDASLAEAFHPYQLDGLVPARAAVEHRSEYVVYTELGELRAVPSGRLRHADEHPAVGDWLAVAPRADEGTATINAVLPRRSAFVRKVAFMETNPQIVAANVDVVFVVCGLEVESIAYGVPVHAVSTPRGDGVETVRSYVPTGRTAALLGSSGVGKSTLVNALVGDRVLATRDVREDGRGRHTTTHRQLVPLPDGGLVLDTPGMRELHLWEAPDGLDAAFEDVGELAARCRFADCAHGREPGCAVRAALAEGTLDVERFESWRKLHRELERLARKQDARARSDTRKERARFARSLRKTSY